MASPTWLEVLFSLGLNGEVEAMTKGTELEMEPVA